MMILLFVLKGILWCLLGLIFLFVFLCFLPIRYHGKGCYHPDRKEFTLKGTWLFGLFHIVFSVPRQSTPVLKLMWIPIYPRKRKQKSLKRRQRKDKSEPKKDDSPAKTIQEDVPVKREYRADADTEKDVTDNSEVFPKSKSKRIKEKSKSIKEKWETLRNRFVQMIQSTEELRKKAVYLKGLSENPLFTEALMKFVKKLKRFLCRISPGYLRITGSFGTGEPDLTGYLYGFFCMFFPWVGKNIQLQPDFERRVLKGDLSFRGMICPVLAVWNTVVLFTHYKQLKKIINK